MAPVQPILEALPRDRPHLQVTAQPAHLSRLRLARHQSWEGRNRRLTRWWADSVKTESECKGDPTACITAACKKYGV